MANSSGSTITNPNTSRNGARNRYPTSPCRFRRRPRLLGVEVTARSSPVGLAVLDEDAHTPRGYPHGHARADGLMADGIDDRGRRHEVSRSPRPVVDEVGRPAVRQACTRSADARSGGDPGTHTSLLEDPGGHTSRQLAVGYRADRGDSTCAGQVRGDRWPATEVG